LAGFFESIEMNLLEKILLLGFLGGLMGFIPAWIAGQPIQLILFALLGAAAAIFEKFLAGKPARIILFGAIGVLIGGGLALFVSPYTAIVTGVLGGLIGASLSMQLGGSLYSNITMRAMDIVLAFPSYLLAIAIVAFLGTGLEKGMIAIGIVGIPIYARLVRSSVLSVTQKEYILAAQSVGEGHGRIIFRHIFPNVLSPITVQATLGIGSAILTAAALGFLGLGAVPPEPEWGAMLGDSYKYLSSGAWWAVVFPGVAIMLVVLGFNLLGDGLRDALDPKLKV
jgi:peptide/nickel transport system permease protein